MSDGMKRYASEYYVNNTTDAKLNEAKSYVDNKLKKLVN